MTCVCETTDIYLVLSVNFTICQRLTPTELKVMIYNVTHIENVTETKECLPAINGEYHPEIPYLFMSCDVNSFFLIKMTKGLNEYACTNFQCWESMLTDVTRMEILDIFNKYRQSIARGTCDSWCKTNKKKLVFELDWQYFFELDAWYYIQNCPTSNAELNLWSPNVDYRNSPPSLQHFSRKGEFISTTFQVKNGLQQELRAKLGDLIKGNYLLDWNETTKQYRRGLTKDVGCAYVVRYGVTMMTALQESVQNGNVAHFGCFFANLYYNTSVTSNDGDCTTENCEKELSDSMVESDSLYPSLCRETKDFGNAENPKILCQPDKKYHGKDMEKICPGSKSRRNSITWNEKAYGYIIRYKTPFGQGGNPEESRSKFIGAECYLPKSLKPTGTENNKNLKDDCTFQHEVDLVADSSACPGWSCNDSQLTNETRQNILNSLNQARHLVAQGLCPESCPSPCKCNKIQYCNIVKLRWHWYLELKAAGKVQNCPNEYSSKKVQFEDSPFQKSSEQVFLEEVSLKFDLPVEGQMRLADEIAELFWTNRLGDWKEDGAFRRGNAAWIGCAIVIQPGNKTSNIHMVCIYMSLDEDFLSKKGTLTNQCCPTCTSVSESVTCRLKTLKNIAPFPALCSSVLSLDITMNCAVNKCASLVSTSTSLQPPSNKKADSNKTEKSYVGRKICKIFIFLYCIALSALCVVFSLYYKYFVEKRYFK